MEYGSEDEAIRREACERCYKAIDAQKEAISKGKITQALRCQEQLKIYKNELDEEGIKEVTNYKREKFAELVQTREQLEEKLQSWTATMKGMYRREHVEDRKKVMEKIQVLKNRGKAKIAEEQIEI